MGKKKKKKDKSVEKEEVGEEDKVSGDTVAAAPTIDHKSSLVAAYDSQDEVQQQTEVKSEENNEKVVDVGKGGEVEVMPKGFKNSFSAVTQEKPSIVLPTLVFDSGTSSLTPKEDASVQQQSDIQQQTKSKSRKSSREPSSGQVPEPASSHH